MAVIEPQQECDEEVQFSEPKRGVYKRVIVCEGRLIGAILLGDMNKAAFLTQAFERETPLPEERLDLLFDLATPSQQITFKEMPDEIQICNCNGVAKGDIGCCVMGGARTARAASIAAYRDPWLEACAPATANQFAAVLPAKVDGDIAHVR